LERPADQICASQRPSGPVHLRRSQINPRLVSTAYGGRRAGERYMAIHVATPQTAPASP